MTITAAQVIADDIMNGNVHLYSIREMTQAEDALWSASRVDYNRLDALAIGKSAHDAATDKRLTQR